MFTIISFAHLFALSQISENNIATVMQIDEHSDHARFRGFVRKTMLNTCNVIILKITEKFYIQPTV